MKTVITNMTKTHWGLVSKIYQKGIDTGNATFQSKAPDYSEWNKNHLKHSRLVYLLNDKVVGWASLSPVSNRCVYEGVAEVSVYVDGNFHGKNIGSQLLKELIIKSEENGIWTLQAGIFPENIASIKIHEKLGFRKIGLREKIGKLNGTWRDILFFEKRSNSIGIE